MNTPDEFRQLLLFGDQEFGTIKIGISTILVKSELQKIRTGRAHPGILDQVHIDYYGSMVPIRVSYRSPM